MSTLASFVGLRVRQLRRLQGRSQEDLAEQVGLSPETISNIERAQHPPSLGTLERLLKALGVEASSFFSTCSDEVRDSAVTADLMTDGA